MRRIAQSVDGDALDDALSGWLRRGGGDIQIVSVDGKAVRGAVNNEGKTPHLVAAFSVDGVVLSQRQVDAKSNEVTAFQPLLSNLDIAGKLVTADALHTHARTGRWLVEVKQAHYLMPAKENQPTLFWGLDALAWRDVPKHITIDLGHGRVEERSIQVLPMPQHLGFPHDGIGCPRRTLCVQSGWNSALAGGSRLPDRPDRESRTGCTGYAMSPAARTPPKHIPATLPGSWPACVTSRSACCAKPDRPTSPKPCATTPATPNRSCNSCEYEPVRAHQPHDLDFDGALELDPR